MKRQQIQYKVKEHVLLKNAFNNSDIVGDIINEEEIDGKLFYIVKSNNRVLKLAKDAYTINRVK
jgi:hypothetical protein